MRALFFRLLARDFQAGHLNLLALALVISVFAMATVLSLADRFERSIKARAASLLASDVLLVSDHPIKPGFEIEAQRLGFRIMHTAVFPGMVTVGEQTMLASIKAVSSNYPLRGKLKLASAQDETVINKVLPGTVWLEQSLLDRLQASIADRVRLGDKSFLIGGVIREEPDRVAAFINFAPRLMLHRDDLESTGLIQEGSRVTWRMGLAHDDAAALKRWIAQHEDALEKGQRIEAQDAGRPEIQLTMQRAKTPWFDCLNHRHCCLRRNCTLLKALREHAYEAICCHARHGCICSAFIWHCRASVFSDRLFCWGCWCITRYLRGRLAGIADSRKACAAIATC